MNWAAALSFFEVLTVADFTIPVEPRQGSGSREARRLRNTGFIPSNVYARGEKAFPCAVPSKEFCRAAEAARVSTVFTLKSSDKGLDGRWAIVKEIQKDHVAKKVLHVDFQAIHENEEITVRVPLNVTGEAPGVKLDGGILTVSAYEISLTCLPKLIPTSLDISVSELRLGQSIHADSIKLPAGVRLGGNPQETIVSVVAVRQVVEETPAATAEGAAVPAEGAAAAPAEGAAAAPAAGGEAAKGGAPAKGAEAAKPAKGKA
ncbi:MAG: 50S ribosomal protein L25 [Oligoflexia bacterium]|nr:50S ribosomal protein L25 [Oligoflexia bacterium]